MAFSCKVPNYKYQHQWSLRLPKSDQTAVKVFLRNTKKIILFGTTLRIANNLMLVMVSERGTKRNTQGEFSTFWAVLTKTLPRDGQLRKQRVVETTSTDQYLIALDPHLHTRRPLFYWETLCPETFSFSVLFGAPIGTIQSIKSSLNQVRLLFSNTQKSPGLGEPD